MEKIELASKPTFVDYTYAGKFGETEFLLVDHENEDLYVDWMGSNPDNELEINRLIIELHNKQQ